MKLWDKGQDLNIEIERFTVGDDYFLDQKLVYWDCIASIAHALMLMKIGIISKQEFAQLQIGLNEIIDKKGGFKINIEDEDCHTAIENYLTSKFSAGKKIHTARSRNDQVLAALKLYMKSELLELEELILGFCNVMLIFSRENDVLMPGYTHMRKAMPSSAGLWSSSFVESMLDNLKFLTAAFEIIDTCPLGSAAGYGIPMKIDRQYVSDLLGFSKVQDNAIYVQNARGKNEAQVISSLMNIMVDLNKMATDMVLFSMEEFGYFVLPEEYCTGSSIMPQKKNPDVLELVRAKSKVVESNYFQVIGIMQNLPTGYNRDIQLTKKPLIETVEITKTCLKIMILVIQSLKVNEKNCRKALTNELFATHNAYEHVKKGMPFREAYKKAACEGFSKMDIDLPKIRDYKAEIEHQTKILNEKKGFFEKHIHDLLL